MEDVNIAELEEDARDTFATLTGGAETITTAQFKSSLGELMGADGELPADAKENLAAILETVATIIDSDSSGTITEAEFVASAKLFLTIASGDSPFDNPDTFFDLLDLDHSGSVSVKELMALFTALVPKGTDQAIIKSIVDDIMAVGDSSGDGELSREEVRSIADKIRTMF